MAGIKGYGRDRDMVITNSSFIRPAKRLAKSNVCALLDQLEIAKWR